jgi:hypothetical protein
MKARLGRWIPLLICLFAWTSAALATDESVSLATGAPGAPLVSPGATNYGIASSISAPIWVTDFEILHNGPVEGTQSSTTGARTCSAGGCPFIATLHLPTGAHVTSYDFDLCDGDPTVSVQFFMFQTSSPVSGVLPIGVGGDTGVAATPGCATFSTPVDFTVDNSSNFYLIDAIVPAGTGMALGGGRVHYNLQVSPAPGAATFGDVPTGHPFFQYIEALAASGITGGCGSGNYCPDNPLTRGQMAVFLAKALGLHFPN